MDSTRLKELITRPVDSYEISKQTEGLRKAVELIDDLFCDRCSVCRIFNPQHKDCPSCGDMDDFRGRLSEIIGIPYTEINQ